MAVDGVDQFALRHIPDLDFTGSRRQPAGGRQQLAVAREGKGANRVGFACQRRDRLLAGGIKQPDLLESGQRDQLAIRASRPDRRSAASSDPLRLEVAGDGRGLGAAATSPAAGGFAPASIQS